MSFVHLHLHTQYSLLDGANKIDELIPRVKELGMPAVAMTDHGNMFGAVHFYHAARQAGIQPILGCEVYVAPASRFEKKGRVDDYEAGGNHHLTLLARTMDGYRNLCRLVSAGYLDGFYYKPRIDKELLRELHEGIIALSGCLSGEVNTKLLAGNVDGARACMEEYARIFPDRYYVEIQDNKLEDQNRANRELVHLARELGLPLVATNDCHYLHPHDAKSHEVLLCVQSGSSIDDPKAWKLGTHELFVKSPAEMHAGFEEFPEAITNTLDIAAQCDVELTSDYQFPVFQVPAGQSLESTLEEYARDGLERRLEPLRATEAWTDDKETTYRDRLALELRVILEMGFAGYFLIVADFIAEAKRQGIPVGPGRGSAAGSLVAWALGVTDIDPIPYGLLFERFLNPERKSMPDIDVDFCFERRDEVLRYVREKYGEDRVAQIITFGTLKGKQAIKDVGRVLGLNFKETDQIAKLYPAPKQGKDRPLKEALEMEKALRDVRDRGEREHELFEHALRLEGLFRHASKHAAGVVISNRPLVEYAPLCKLPNDPEGSILTQFVGTDIERIGLIKFDFLGLKTLTFVHKIVGLVRESKGVTIDLSSLPLDDPETYRLLGRGDGVGVFQMESSGMRKLLAELKPSTFEDLIAVLALYRPGPLDSGMHEEFVKRKHGKVPIQVLHPLLEPILRETYGVIVYQEQVMRIAQVLAGYSLGDADNLRKAMGKKIAEKMKLERIRFVEGACERRIPRELATKIFDQMETFGAYGFNKSHSAAYALLSYQTAHLKAHHPVEFFAALLSLEKADADKTHKNIMACRERGIRVLPPDINESREDFTVVGADIRFGFEAVKGVGRKAAELILDARQAGPFASLSDLCLRVRRTGEGSQINRKVVESLIKCGAFDSLEPARAPLAHALEDILRWAERVERDAASNQMGLFGSGNGSTEAHPPPLPDVPEWPDRDRLRAEKEALGFFITAHPLDKVESDLRRLTNATTSTLGQRGSGGRSAKVSLGGVIHTIRLKNDRSGNRYATFLLEDREGTVEVIVWHKTYDAHKELIHADDPVLLTGSVDVREEGCQVIAETIQRLVEVREKSARRIDFRVRADQVTEAHLRDLRETLARYRGPCPAFLHLVVPEGGETVIELPGTLAVTPSEELVEAVESLLGSGVARLS